MEYAEVKETHSENANTSIPTTTTTTSSSSSSSSHSHGKASRQTREGQGRYSKQEDEKLMAIVESFCASRGIALIDLAASFDSHKGKDEGNDQAKAEQNKDLHQMIKGALPSRSAPSMYKRVLRLVSLRANDPPSRNRYISGEETEIKTGKYSKKEDEAIMAIVESYCVSRGMAITDLVPSFRDPGDKPQKQNKELYRMIKDELPNRTAHSIYRHTTRLVCSSTRKGRFTEEEKETVQQLYDKHGPKWQLIAQEMGRFFDDVRDLWRSLSKPKNEFRFSDEHDELLLELMKKYTNTEDVYELVHVSNIPWASIKAEWPHPTCGSQLLSHWRNSLRRKLIKKRDAPSVKFSGDPWILIEHLYDEGYSDETEVRWGDITRKLSLGTEASVLWQNLGRCLPDATGMLFDERVERLRDMLINSNEAPNKPVTDEYTVVEMIEQNAEPSRKRKRTNSRLNEVDTPMTGGTDMLQTSTGATNQTIKLDDADPPSGVEPGPPKKSHKKQPKRRSIEGLILKQAKARTFAKNLVASGHQSFREVLRRTTEQVLSNSGLVSGVKEAALLHEIQSSLHHFKKLKIEGDKVYLAKIKKNVLNK